MSEPLIDAVTITAAVTLSAALGGAKVTLEVPMDVDTAAALGREIRAGFEDGPGVPWVVESLTVTGDPPHVAAIKVTVGGSDHGKPKA